MLLIFIIPKVRPEDGRANIVPVPVLDREIAGRKIVAIVTETEIEIVTETETVIAIVIVDADQDQEIEENVIETAMATEIGIDGIEIEIETEEGNDRSRRLHFPEQGYRLERVSAPLA